jgi:rhodanese-related sulfurtransferase
MAPRRALLTLLAVLGLSLGLSLGLAGCGSDASPTSTAGDATYDHVDADTFADRIAERDVVLLDVRTPEEYAAGHLEGATNLPLADADFAKAVADLDPDTTYAVYCRTGVRSQQAMEAMRRAGIEAVYDLDGGITAWTRSGRLTVTG